MCLVLGCEYVHFVFTSLCIPARHSAHKRIAKCARNASATRAVRLMQVHHAIPKGMANLSGNVAAVAYVLQSLARIKTRMTCAMCQAAVAETMANAGLDRTLMALMMPCCSVYVGMHRNVWFIHWSLTIPQFRFSGCKATTHLCMCPMLQMCLQPEHWQPRMRIG